MGPFAAVVNATLAFALSAEQQTALRVFQQANDTVRLTRSLAEMISAADYISWSTWGHDAVGVNLYCAGRCAADGEAKLDVHWAGSNRNDIIGQRLAAFMGLDAVQASVTANLTGFNTTGHPDGWTGSSRVF